MKEITKMTKNVAMEFLFGHQEMNIEEITLMICATDMERCIGPIQVIIKECGREVFNLVKENCIFLERELEKEFLLIIFLKEIIKMMFLLIMATMIQVKRNNSKKIKRMKRMKKINRKMSVYKVLTMIVTVSFIKNNKIKKYNLLIWRMTARKFMKMMELVENKAHSKIKMMMIIIKIITMQ
jgi:hypothetical protein